MTIPVRGNVRRDRMPRFAQLSEVGQPLLQGLIFPFYGGGHV